MTGTDTLSALSRKTVTLVGVGGVGSWCAEALVRSGITYLALIDSDTVCITNINRQIQATDSTVGQAKVIALKERLETINPSCHIQTYQEIFSRETSSRFNIEQTDVIIDAIDSLGYKLDLIEIACESGKTFFSCMGMAQKMDPTQIKTADIWETKGCPLARLVRAGLKKRGFNQHFTAVYSSESLPRREESTVGCGSGVHCCCPAQKTGPDWCASKKVINGSSVTVTATAGMILASLVLRSIMAAYGT
jgi:tRNA A37 threonylcarbamoyladenosine dehydratase